MLTLSLVFGEECDSVVVLVEVWGIWSEEDIPNDDVREISWKIVTSNSHNALGSSELSNSENVVLLS